MLPVLYYQVIDLKRSSRLMPGRAWSLVFRNVSASDAGSYSCWPYSSIGAGLKSRLFKVLIKGISSEHLMNVLHVVLMEISL